MTIDNWRQRFNQQHNHHQQGAGLQLNQFLTQLQPVLPGLGAAIVAIALSQIKLWQPLEQVAYNTLLQARSQISHPAWDSRIAVIAIDEASLKQYGRFPWSRTRYAQLLQALEPSLPVAIGFDVLFAEPTPEDATLATAMLNSSNVVLARGADSQGVQIEVVPALAQVTRQGHIYNASDRDGVSRRSWLYVKQVPSLSMAMLNLNNENLQHAIASGNSTTRQPTALPQPIPNQPERQEWLNWLDKTEAIPTYSFASVLQGKVKPEAFADKFVLVGITATGFDPLQTPLNQRSPTAGVYLHAATIDNLLNQRFLKSLPTAAVWALVVVLGTAVSYVLHFQGVRGRITTVIGFSWLWFLGALALLNLANLWLPIAAPLGTVLLAAIGTQLREQHERQLLMRLFATHVAPETAAMLWQHKAEIFQNGELQAQELVVTVLFMDIRGFTSISEKLPPSELLRWINRYLDAMTNCIMNHGGVIDKYIGDAIMAVFGVPFPSTTTAAIQQDAMNAIAACMTMHQRLQQLNQDLQAEGKPLIQFGIGVHTGLVVAGSIGSRRRSNYSVLGDTVNIAARLESLNKNIQEHNPYRILVTCETLSCVGHRYCSHPVGALPLKGREQPTMVFSITAEKMSGSLSL